MKIKLLYFAAVRDLVGSDEEDVELPANVTTIESLATFLEARHVRLEGRLAAVRFAKNETFAEKHEALGSGDVVALIPPVAGG